MGYKVQFENGHTVEFDTQPSETDIDEAFKHTQSLPQPNQDGIGKKLLGGLEGVAHAVSGVASAIPTGIRTLAEMAGGADLGTALERSESTADAATYSPRTATGKAVGKGITDTMQDYSHEVSDKFSGDLAYLNQQKMNKGTLTASDLAGENTERFVGDILGSAYAPGVPVAGVGKRAPVAKKIVGGDVASAAAELTKNTEGEYTAPPPMSRQPGTQGELFTSPTIKEKIGNKENTVQPGAASQYDPFQEQTPFNPNTERARLSRNQELPFNEGMPDVIRQTPEGRGDMLPQDPGFAAAAARQEGQVGAEGPGFAKGPVYKQGDLFGDMIMGEQQKFDLPPRPEPIVPTKQGEIFEPQTNMHRDFTDRWVDDGQGGKRPMTPAEFERTTQNLEGQEGTRFRKGEDAYSDYQASIDPKQRGLFDIGSDQAAFKEGVYQDQVPKMAEQNPFVRKAAERVAKQEELVIKLSGEVEAGNAPQSMLDRALRDLRNFEKTHSEATKNVTEGLRNKPISSRTRAGRQRGAIDVNAIKDAAEKLGRGVLSAREYLDSWKGAFDSRQWDKHIKALDNPDSHSTVVLMSPREFHRAAAPRSKNPYEPNALDDAPRLHQNIKNGLAGERGLLEAPQLWLKKSKDADVLQVAGHEGRHRMDVFREMGVSKVPVIIDAQSAGVKWGRDETLPSQIRPEWVGDSSVLDLPMPATLHDGPPSPHRAPGPYGAGRKQGGWIWKDPSKQKAAGKLLGDLGVRNALQEIAPSQMTPRQVLEQAYKSKDVEQNFFQKTANMFTKGGMYQALKTHNPVVRFVVENILHADQLARADIRDMVHARLSPAMRALNKQEQAKIWAMMELADLSQKPLDLELLARHGFNEKQLHLVEEHKAVMDYSFDMINKAREAAGKEPIQKRTAYAAMRATGDFRRLVYEKGTKEVVGVIGSDYRAKVNKLQKQMEEKGYEVGEERYFGGGAANRRGSANEAFQQAVEFLAESDPRVQGFVDVLNEIRTQETYNFLNAKTHTMDKKGVFGMEGRKPWKDAEDNALDGLQAQLNYAETAIKWGHLSEAMGKIKEVTSDKDLKMPNAKQWSEEYMYNALGFNPSEFGRNTEAAVARVFQKTGVGYSVGRQAMALARKTANTMVLGLNPAFWATNVIQPMSSMPAMKAYLVAKGLDSKFDFGTGWSYLGAGSITAAKLQAGLKLSGLEQQAAKYADTHHVYGSDLVEHSNRARSGFGTTMDAIGNSITGPIESSTRRVMFYGFVHLLSENGMTPKGGLFESAHNLTDMSMNNYSAVERPQLYNKLGPVGDIAANLQSYKHNELSRLALFARQVGEEKSMRPVLTQLAAGVSVAGITGLIGFQEADWLYKQVTKAAGNPDSLAALTIRMSEGVGNKINEFTGRKENDIGDARHLASHGLFSALGMDMSKRLGQPDLIPDSAVDALFPGGAKLGSVAGSWFDLAKNPSEANGRRALRETLPVGMEGAADRAMFSKDLPDGSELALNTKTLRGTAIRNKNDQVLKTMGFTGINESVQKQKVYEVEWKSKAYAELRQKPLDQMRDQIFTKGSVDKELITKYMNLRGNEQTLEGDLQRYAMEQNMSAEQLALFRSTATQSIANLQKAKDYLEMFSK